MKIVLPLSFIISIFLAALSPNQGYADTPNGPFHKVAFVVTTPDPPDNLQPIPNAEAEGDLIAKRLNEDGYLVIQYPDPKPNYKNPLEFDEKLQYVKGFAQSSDKLGDVTLFYYLGHGQANGIDEELRIPGHHDHNNDGYVSLSWILHVLTESDKTTERAVLLLINACRDNSTVAVGSVPNSSNETNLSTYSDLVLEEKATTSGLNATMNLADLVGSEGLNADDCIGIFPKSLALKFPIPRPGPDNTKEQTEQAKIMLSPYADMDISPFGAAFLLSIKYSNRSLWDINTSLGNNMRCFTRGGGDGFPVAYTPAELPANMLQYYYFGVKRPDSDNRP